jgi:hypothetical protein
VVLDCGASCKKRVLLRVLVWVLKPSGHCSRVSVSELAKVMLMLHVHPGSERGMQRCCCCCHWPRSSCCEYQQMTHCDRNYYNHMLCVLFVLQHVSATPCVVG